MINIKGKIMVQIRVSLIFMLLTISALLFTWPSQAKAGGVEIDIRIPHIGDIYIHKKRKRHYKKHYRDERYFRHRRRSHCDRFCRKQRRIDQYYESQAYREYMRNQYHRRYGY